MPTLTVVGEDDPFLHVSLKAGESLWCERDAMVMMEDTLDLEGRMQGGFFQALMRRWANDESFFQQHIKAHRGAGDCLLSPTLPGALQILEVGERQYRISDQAYVAATDGVAVKAKMQSLSRALFANTGGFFVGESSGQGQLVVSGFGSVFELVIKPETPMIIDNGHVVAWDTTLQHEFTITFSKNTGVLGSLWHGQTSGEGLAVRFSGSGRVVVCSRNRSGFLAWLKAKITPTSS
jgi:uncharacterized protein (TIGR00266 family)